MIVDHTQPQADDEPPFGRGDGEDAMAGASQVKTGGIRAALALDDAFAGYVLEEDRVDRQGWNSQHSFFEVAIATAKPKLIIELGVWKGMSSIHMAAILKKLGIAAEVLAIDTWLGSSAHLSSPGRQSELAKFNGYPTLYRTFLANVKAEGHDDVIVPLAMDGASAAYALRRMGIQAGVIHIDASHEYEAALADFRAFWPMLAEDGVLICDDYGIWPGVTRAANQFAAEVDRPIFATMAKALIPKKPTLGFETKITRARRYRRVDFDAKEPSL